MNGLTSVSRYDLCYYISGDARWRGQGADFSKGIVDTTVQPKAVAFPTDAKLMPRARERLVKLAHKTGVELRQSYERVGKHALIAHLRPRDGPRFRIGGMDRQTLRDWVHRFNAAGPEGLIDSWTEGPKPRLSAGQLADFAAIVEAGPDRERDGVVRWRRVDLKRVIVERFGVDFHERYLGKLLKKLGFSHMSARPRHPAQDERIVEAIKNVWPAPSARGFVEIGC